MSSPSTEIPIFLRKTYALIESCSKDAPRVCAWTDDGKTFTVFDLDQFEQKQIPLYFKHSKFSSFVRQLNFYSFRKIKEDAIRLDVDSSNDKNHWKFRHDKFQRGRPGLMAEMKRTASRQTPKPAVVVAAAASSVSSLAVQPQGNKEVQNLKKRIEEMNKSIDALTAMVEKVSLKQDQDEKIEAGNKRKKIDSAVDEMPLDVFSEPFGLSSNLLDSDNDMTDDAFLDQLFVSFQDEGASSVAVPDEIVSEEVPSSPPENSNRPDPVLMKKLGDALELLPKVIQEMIIHRLIHAITEGLDEPMPTLAALLHEGKKLQKAIPVIPVHA